MWHADFAFARLRQTVRARFAYGTVMRICDSVNNLNNPYNTLMATWYVGMLVGINSTRSQLSMRL